MTVVSGPSGLNRKSVEQFPADFTGGREGGQSKRILRIISFSTGVHTSIGMLHSFSTCRVMIAVASLSIIRHKSEHEAIRLATGGRLVTRTEARRG